jgi:N-acetylglucosaminyldiphosphoundecaprenol N-acetyl-beta-D-mannosaminyltransferase
MNTPIELISSLTIVQSPAKRIRVAGCPVDHLSFASAEAEICQRIEMGIPAHVVFVNAAKVVNYRRDRRLRQAVDRADLLLADGVPVVWASRLLGRSLPGRVNGTDLMERMVKVAAERGYRVFFLGARRQVLNRAIEEFKRRYPGLLVAGSRDGYFGPEEERSVIAEIAASRAQLLFLAISSPQKEVWADKNLDQLGSIVCQGVGGSIDVVAGITRRAPVWMQRNGLEWFFRLLQEPGRMWRRYLETNSQFIWMVGKDLARGCFSVDDRKQA